MQIEKKVWPEFFTRITSGEKNFEIRLADFKCEPGDVLVLKEWDPKSGSYTGRQVEKAVKYVARLDTANLEKFYKKEELDKYGLQVIGL